MTRTVGFIYAHPDDETFGCSYLIRQIADSGNKAVLLTATRGEAGKSGRLGAMTREQLAEIRDQELQRAGDILGIAEIEQLDLGDGKLREVKQEVLVDTIAAFLNKHGAEVVVTFPADGISGHPDHIAIHHAVNKAVFSGACSTVQKLYYNVMGSQGAGAVLELKGEEGLHETKAKALAAHESQILSIERVFGKLDDGPPWHFAPELFQLVWERESFNPAKQERSIFDGLVN
ncbi:PIG-L deacetylase family protein [Paenibacillus woosongensis]|uniref:PIG-L family deacetylase n=1 Tax=Paenibacillus woosongensis TaxID=307580 RepID=A0A7X3CM98_9BACL|nr:PIG-L family deacetylase [Paenibacillus woosongensis]MUG44950.1 PIG-L family deacetylase [Paenibacillus woosongensis]